MTSKELSIYLSSINNDVSLVDKIKIVYRPYICPFNTLIEYCKNSKSILDIGCGSGQLLLLLGKYTSATKLGGIEISERLIGNATELLASAGKTNFRLEKYDGIHIPAFVSEYETLTLIDVFHHIEKEKQRQFISELYKNMKPGGRLIFKDINAAHPLLFMSKLHDLVLAGEMVNMISLSQAKKMLENAGFKITSVSKRLMLWYPHYTIVCIK